MNSPENPKLNLDKASAKSELYKLAKRGTASFGLIAGATGGYIYEKSGEIEPVSVVLSAGLIASSGLAAYLERRHNDAAIEFLPADERRNALRQFRAYGVDAAGMIAASEEDIERVPKGLDRFQSYLYIGKVGKRFQQLPELSLYALSVGRLLRVREAAAFGQDMNTPLSDMKLGLTGNAFVEAFRYTYYQREQQLAKPLHTVANPGKLPEYDYMTEELQARPARESFEFREEVLSHLIMFYREQLEPEWRPVVEYVSPYIDNSSFRGSEIKAGVALAVLAIAQAYSSSLRAHNKTLDRRVNSRLKAMSKQFETWDTQEESNDLES